MANISNLNVDGIAHKIGTSITTVGSGEIPVGYFADSACTKEIKSVNDLIGAMESASIYKKLFNPSGVSWASGSDSDIEEMLAAAYSGAINLSDYWNVGDSRTVTLQSMAATGVGESHVAQEVDIVIQDLAPSYMAEDGTAPKLLWGLKDALKEAGYMNSSNTNSGGWDSCARRTWCNNVFYPALPELFRKLTKTVNVVAANGSSTTTATSKDKCFLLSEKEIFGSTSYADGTAEAGLKQVPYYATTSNRVKKLGKGGSASFWWERSPGSGNSNYFCFVYSDGTASGNTAGGTRGLAPCGCF